MTEERFAELNKIIQDRNKERAFEIVVEKIAAEFSVNMDLEAERDKGYKEGLEKAAQNALAEGVPVELVSKITMLDIDRVRELSDTIQA